MYDDKIVVEFLKFGWPINCNTTILLKSTLRNHGSAAGGNGERILNTYISKELSYQSVCGPYKCNPFSTDCVISPLQCVPKHDSAEPTIVHDLSFPLDASVNSCIPSDTFLNKPYKLILPGIDRLVEFVNQLGRGCHVSKKDLKRAYHQIPVDPADYHLLGMCINGSFYFHTTLPLGLWSATMACQRTTKAVTHILNNHGILADVYIDDFMALLHLKHRTPILRAWIEFFQSSVCKLHQIRTSHPAAKWLVSEYRSTPPAWF